MADDDKTDLVEDLTEATCRRHLAAETVGRIALVSDGRVEMFPVNYAMSDGAVVIRTHLGGALASLGDRSGRWARCGSSPVGGPPPRAGCPGPRAARRRPGR